MCVFLTFSLSFALLKTYFCMVVCMYYVCSMCVLLALPLSFALPRVYVCSVVCVFYVCFYNLSVVLCFAQGVFLLSCVCVFNVCFLTFSLSFALPKLYFCSFVCVFYVCFSYFFVVLRVAQDISMFSYNKYNNKSIVNFYIYFCLVVCVTRVFFLPFSYPSRCPGRICVVCAFYVCSNVCFSYLLVVLLVAKGVFVLCACSMCVLMCVFLTFSLSFAFPNAYFWSYLRRICRFHILLL